MSDNHPPSDGPSGQGWGPGTETSQHIIVILGITVPAVFFTLLLCFFFTRYAVRKRRAHAMSFIQSMSDRMDERLGGTMVQADRSALRPGGFTVAGTIGYNGRRRQNSVTGPPMLENDWDLESQEAGVHAQSDETEEEGEESDVEHENLPKYEPDRRSSHPLAPLDVPAAPSPARRVSSPPPAYHP
ncbi:uncharacterized protein SPPG_03950 [Spizellomyces punctatus DAOM BR117]|uniref:Uncharacterized protein n=1 Tax=Spizellomyces punctatus (strain DAOM BR117) TaxID=645134 RepID=A0A0L0HHA3_SPIPD|nr:uncharacterized protein SPPG_03950 [Spizellomyces punctatus DAOM BR117]KND00846.1 hypothetical protein SPPG_03950 [Spizellomyces punctatus DAOM BR117]|eukprot:XP_016608885.1 hypothetical protein SPPG_03950 [Spizellomyces punctatus DAOM BR117]